MAQPYVGEIRMFAGNFAPAGWMFCEGQLLPISENETLFQLIGTTYGGDGESTFALPDLRGRLPIHQGNGVHPRRDRRRGGDHADDQPDPSAHAPAHSPPTRSAPDQPRRSRSRRQTVGGLRLYVEDSPTDHHDTAVGQPGGRQPAAHQLPAVPLRRLHHLAVRHLPVPDLGATDHGRSIRRGDPHLPVQLRAQGLGVVQRSAAAAIARTRRCSRCSARPTAATASPPSRCPNLQGRAPMHPGQGPGLSLHDLGETGGSETVTLLESEIPAHTHSMSANDRHRRQRIPGAQRSLAAVDRRERATRRPRNLTPDGAAGAHAGRRQPAAQQPACPT